MVIFFAVNRNVLPVVRENQAYIGVSLKYNSAVRLSFTIVGKCRVLSMHRQRRYTEARVAALSVSA
jgi:hypothetical protein